MFVGMTTPPDSVRIRPGQPADAAAIGDLIEHENHRPADRGVIAAYLAAAPSVVAEYDGELAGMIYARPFSPDIIEWRNSLVAAHVRRQGVGRDLVAAMEQASIDAGYRAAIGVNCLLHPGATREGAAAARAFWHRMHWTVIFATDGSAVIARHF
jgi:predicted N-acetyltransferase YhbS